MTYNLSNSIKMVLLVYTLIMFTIYLSLDTLYTEETVLLTPAVEVTIYIDFFSVPSIISWGSNQIVYNQ